MEWHSNPGRRLYRKVVTIAVVFAVILVPLTGAVAAQEEAGTATANGTFVAAQGEQCTEIQAFSGTETPREFYDYRLPIENNSYANATGQSYSAEGLADLQRANTSAVFLYQQVPDESDQITGPLQPEEPRAEDRSLSLVIVHGSLDNDSAGGAVTFDITGLPEDGRWTVKDDEYDGPRSYDNWSADSGDTVVDWTWQGGSTDGGVYTGLDEDDNVTIRPAFNEEAALWQEYYDGRVDDWELLSNETSDAGAANNSSITRIPLDKRVPLQLSGDDCEAVTDRNVTDPEPTVDSGTETDEEPVVVGAETETETDEEAETDEEPVVIGEETEVEAETESEEAETDAEPIDIGNETDVEAETETEEETEIIEETETETEEETETDEEIETEEETETEAVEETETETDEETETEEDPEA